MRAVVLLIFLLPLCSSSKIILNCPEEVFLDEEFECEVLFKDNFLSYDVKLNLIGDGKTINRVWDGNDWSRSDWYVKDLINGNRTFIRIKLSKPFLGKSKGSFKIRSSKKNKVIHEEMFEIEVKEHQNTSKKSLNSIQDELVLNSKDIKTENIVLLQDKDFLLYFGIVSLGAISGTLYFVKIKNGRRKYKEDTFGNYY